MSHLLHIFSALVRLMALIVGYTVLIYSFATIMYLHYLSLMYVLKHYFK